MNGSNVNHRRTVTDTIIVTAVRKYEPEATTSQVADEIGLSLQITRYRLSRLELLGGLESETDGGTDLWRTTSTTCPNAR